MKITKPSEYLETDDRELAHSKLTFRQAIELMVEFQHVRDLKYNSHWAHRGLQGYAHGCIYRQTDKIEPGIKRLFHAVYDSIVTGGAFLASELTENAAYSLMDMLWDTAVYSILGVCLLSAKFPNAGEDFLNFVQDEIAKLSDLDPVKDDAISEATLSATMRPSTAVSDPSNVQKILDATNRKTKWEDE